MKKASFVSVLALVVGMLTVTAVMSQPQPAEVDFRLDQPVPKVEQLRQRYSALAAQRAKQMTEQELEQAIQQMEKQSQEAVARERLEKAASALEAIVREFPDTEAANSARRGLAAISPPFLEDPSFSEEPQRQATPPRRREPPLPHSR